MGRQLTQAGPIPPALSELIGALDTLWEATIIKLSPKADRCARTPICYVHNEQLITGLKVWMQECYMYAILYDSIGAICQCPRLSGAHEPFVNAHLPHY